jgi:hypothetical protein
VLGDFAIPVDIHVSWCVIGRIGPVFLSDVTFSIATTAIAPRKQMTLAIVSKIE